MKRPDREPPHLSLTIEVSGVTQREADLLQRAVESALRVWSNHTGIGLDKGQTTVDISTPYEPFRGS